MLASAIALAIAFWGPPPPACATVAYHVASLPEPVLGQMAYYDGWCEVQIDRRPWRWGPLCSTLVHETGHAHGLGHSTDESDVMFPVLLRTADACRGKRPSRYPRGTVIRFP
jgi:hypothetical protein